jgi:hypothetical protein
LRNQTAFGYAKQVPEAKADISRASVRILVVDDFAPWRQYVCSMLQTWLKFCMVAEARDGLEAVQ